MEVVKNSGMPMIIGVPDGSLLFTNKAACNLFLYTTEEFYRLHRNDLFSSAIDDLYKSIQTKSDKEIFRLELTAVKKTGEKFPCEVIASVFKTENGNSVISLVILDISQEIDQKRMAEEKLKHSNEQFYYALQATSDIIWDWNLENNNIQWSDNYTKIMGYQLPADSCLTLDFCMKNFYPQDIDHVLASLKKAIDDPSVKNWECEFRYKRKNGTYAFVRDRGVILRDENNKAVRMIGAMHDDSEQKYQQSLLALELNIFEISSTHAVPFSVVVNSLLQGIEAIHPDTYTSVLLLSETNTLKHLAAPSLAPGYLQLVDGIPIGPAVGSCGTAMYTKQPVIVSDINTDELWAPYREIANEFGLKACWSVPIIDRNGKVMASFAIYYKQIKEPTEGEWNTIIRIRNLLRILMENHHSIEQMRISNERYDIVSKATHDLIWDWDLEKGELYRDPEGLKKVYGISNNESIKNINSWLGRIHPDDLEKVQDMINTILQTRDQDTFDMEYRFRGEDNNYSNVYDRGYVMRNSENKPYRMIGAAQNITERKRLEQEVLNAELNRQKAISQITIETQEKERTEIGKELHDNVNQILTTTKLYLDLATTKPELKDELIEKSSKNIINAITEIRQLSRSLMLPSLGDLGLIDSIEDLVEDINATKKIYVVFAYKNFEENMLTENQKLMMYRIVQEALNNVIRHAEATETVIELSATKSKINLFIKDNGKGFNSVTIKKGAGLNNIRNRVYLSNGSLMINTHPGEGCTLLVELPYRV